MFSRFRHSAHLVGLVLVVLAALAVFAVLRQAVVPPSFGQYGHFRGSSLDDNRARKISFAGQDTCVLCHEEVAAARAQGGHRRVACEACHGAQAKHADDPGALKPPHVMKDGFCARCHEKDGAKPVRFKQVESASHSGGAACNECHQPHKPAL
jgi:hypothetical protein